jgi:hypothetical protein
VAEASEVMAMRWAGLLAAGCAATMTLAAGADAQAQGGPRGGGGGFQGGPPPGAIHRPPPAHYPRGGAYFGVYPRTWWGAGYWPGTWWGPGYWPGAYWGPGYWGPGYWGPRYGYVYPPYYDGYPPAYSAPAPPMYVERDAPPQPAEPVWWYWCAEAKAYYPYVKECAGGWQRVPPQPVPERQ